MSHRLRIASWALDRALDEVGDDEVCDLAMDVAGGPAFSRGSIIERAYRDIRAAKFHPLTPEATLVHAGRLELGLAVDTP